MLQVVVKWLKDAYRRVVTSIAFLPAIIAIALFATCYLMIQFDFSTGGKNVKSNLDWLSLKDASTARSICTVIAGGVISLTVFSFSMVMILLSQAASQMSNRILSKLISNTFQQVVLGFYIGTIVYALFLLSTIRDTDTGISVPAISTYLLITLTVVDIFLFIYFLHYITTSVKYETIIHRIYVDTSEAMRQHCAIRVRPDNRSHPVEGVKVHAQISGYFLGFEDDGLVSLCREENVTLYFLYPVGTYLIKGTPIAIVKGKPPVSERFERKANTFIDLGIGKEININYYFGFKQLMEIAVKALSPGINDPGTASIALQALGDLLAYRLEHFPEPGFSDQDGVFRIVTKEKTFEEMFKEYILPIWDYGKDDRLMQTELIHILTLLQMKGENEEISKLLYKLKAAQGYNEL